MSDEKTINELFKLLGFAVGFIGGLRYGDDPVQNNLTDRTYQYLSDGIDGILRNRNEL